jgi:hypothetical protein
MVKKVRKEKGKWKKKEQMREERECEHGISSRIYDTNPRIFPISTTFATPKLSRGREECKVEVREYLDGQAETRGPIDTVCVHKATDNIHRVILSTRREKLWKKREAAGNEWKRTKRRRRRRRRKRRRKKKKKREELWEKDEKTLTQKAMGRERALEASKLMPSLRIQFQIREG